MIKALRRLFSYLRKKQVYKTAELAKELEDYKVYRENIVCKCKYKMLDLRLIVEIIKTSYGEFYIEEITVGVKFKEFSFKITSKEDKLELVFSIVGKT